MGVGAGAGVGVVPGEGTGAGAGCGADAGSGFGVGRGAGCGAGVGRTGVTGAVAGGWASGRLDGWGMEICGSPRLPAGRTLFGLDTPVWNVLPAAWDAPDEALLLDRLSPDEPSLDVVPVDVVPVDVVPVDVVSLDVVPVDEPSSDAVDPACVESPVVCALSSAFCSASRSCWVGGALMTGLRVVGWGRLVAEATQVARPAPMSMAPAPLKTRTRP